MGVPFRGFATAGGDDAVVGTPSPFGSAMSQHMADRRVALHGLICKLHYPQDGEHLVRIRSPHAKPTQPD